MAQSFTEVETVAEACPELWHYTTARGLEGILTSQQIWATDVLFLNDKDEYIGFFDKRLKEIVERGFKKSQGTELLSSKINKQIRSFVDSFGYLLKQYQVYLTSFCDPNGTDSNDGLLSQWRAYGTDGGYALVFGSLELERLFKKEGDTFFYSAKNFGNVDYDGIEQHKEKRLWESHLETLSCQYANYDKLDIDAKFSFISLVLDSILPLALRHKHAGFQEEKELRMSLVTSTNDKVPEDLLEPLKSRPQKKIRCDIRSGSLVPYISLFDFNEGKKIEEMDRLPVTQIVVGPHPDKEKRKIAVEKMLRQLSIDAEVIISSIPYIGR